MFKSLSHISTLISNKIIKSKISIYLCTVSNILTRNKRLSHKSIADLLNLRKIKFYDPFFFLVCYIHPISDGLFRAERQIVKCCFNFGRKMARSMDGKQYGKSKDTCRLETIDGKRDYFYAELYRKSRSQPRREGVKIRNAYGTFIVRSI